MNSQTQSELAKNAHCTNEAGDADDGGVPVEYQLDQQIGYLLRLANQRHLEIFSAAMPNLTPTQFSMLARLCEVGELSQNELGRRIGIDAATTNGVIDRLTRKGFTQSSADAADKRRLLISLTEAGRRKAAAAMPIAKKITQTTLGNLSSSESQELCRLLQKLQQDTG